MARSAGSVKPQPPAPKAYDPRRGEQKTESQEACLGQGGDRHDRFDELRRQDIDLLIVDLQEDAPSPYVGTDRQAAAISQAGGRCSRHLVAVKVDFHDSPAKVVNNEEPVREG